VGPTDRERHGRWLRSATFARRAKALGTETLPGFDSSGSSESGRLDLFKFRSRVGLDVALEALRAYAGSAHRDLEALRRYARIDGVERVLQPYLEATVA